MTFSLRNAANSSWSRVSVEVNPAVVGSNCEKNAACLKQISRVWGPQVHSTLQLSFPLCANLGHRRRQHGQPCATRTQRILHDGSAFCQPEHGFAQVLLAGAIELQLLGSHHFLESLSFGVCRALAIFLFGLFGRGASNSCGDTRGHFSSEETVAVVLPQNKLLLKFCRVQFLQ